MKNIVAIIDGLEFGSGLGEIVKDKDNHIIASISNNSFDTDRIYQDYSGKYVFCNIPVGILNENTELFIGMGSTICITDFILEYERHEKLLGDRKIYVHEEVRLIDNEEKLLSKFKGYKNAISCSHDEWNNRLDKYVNRSDGYVLLEGGNKHYSIMNKHQNLDINNQISRLCFYSNIPTNCCVHRLFVITPYTVNRKYGINDNSKALLGEVSKLTWSHVNIFSKDNINLRLELKSNLNGEMMYDLIKTSKKEDFSSVISKSNPKLITCLELERLKNKRRGIDKYYSEILDISSEKLFIRDYSGRETKKRPERDIYEIDFNLLEQSCRNNSIDSIYLNFAQQYSSSLYRQYEDIRKIEQSNKLRQNLNILESELGAEILTLGTGNFKHQKINVKKFIK